VTVGRVVGVLGAVDPHGDAWGPVDAHEHLIIAGGNVPERFPGIRLDDVELAARELGDVRAAGGRVIVEATPIGLGRRPHALRHLAERSGLTVVATTGFHKEAYYPADHWVRKADAERLAGYVVADLTEGIDANDLAAPWPEPTDVRAGLIKLATEQHHLTTLQERMFEAGAAAHAATGAPITTHCEHGTFGVDQVRELDRLGIPADAISVGHVDKNPDIGYLRAVAATGAFLIFSNPGRTKYGPDSLWLDLLNRLAGDGHLDQLLVGGDMAPRSMWRAYDGGPGIGWLFSGFFTRLRHELGDAVADAITIDNPRRALTWRPAQESRS
jgi:phosphotriesterase-related protein